MFKAYKYRIYPTDSQAKLIEQTMGCCRLVYNIALQTKIEVYKSNGSNLTAIDLCYQLAEMKQDYEWMRKVDSQALQASVKKVDLAFKNFYNGCGYPKFKSKNGKQSFQCPNNVRRIDFINGLLTISKIRNIPIEISRTFVGKIKTITISKVPSGKYFASILVDNETEFPKKRPIIESDAIGIDLGIKHFAILSDGVKVENPRYLKNNLQRLKCLQKRVSRKKKGSSNRKKAVKRLAIQHELISNMRNDFLHKVSSVITKRYGTLCVESLAIKYMVKNHSLSQSISDVGWGEFVRQLKYKQEWKGGVLLELPRYEPSTKVCNSCGKKNDTLSLLDREWTCINCGTTHDRDINAAINIKQYFFNSRQGMTVEPLELSATAEAKNKEKYLVY